jgi:hypothetical protein
MMPRGTLQTFGANRFSVDGAIGGHMIVPGIVVHVWSCNKVSIH